MSIRFRTFGAVTTAVGLCLAALGAAPASAGAAPPEPVVSTHVPTNNYLLNKDLSMTLRWSATDPDGVNNYWSQFTTKAYDEEDYPWLAEAGMYTADEGEQKISLGPGWSGCAFLSAEDTNGTRGYAKFEEMPCFATPVDDPYILKGNGWRENFARGSYLNTVSVTKKVGETMSFRSAYFTHLGIVVTKGPGYGKIRVTDDDGFINETYSLAATTIKKKAVIEIAAPQEVQDGQPDSSITIRVMSDGKPVKIDGIAALDRRIPL